MIYTLLTIFLIPILLLIFLQDLKKRTIHVGLPIVIFLLALLVNYISLDLNFSVIAYNVTFVLINIIGLTLYLSFKSKSFVNPIDTYIGLGDIVFFLALTPLFNLKPFILFFILGLLFSLLMHVAFMLFKRIQTIPLAGYLSLFLILNILAENFFKINMLF
jgi:hypothetical protein